MNGCVIPDCPRDLHGFGLCMQHYQRWRNTGSPYKPTLLPFEPLEAKIRRGRPVHVASCPWCTNTSQACVKKEDIAIELGVATEYVKFLRDRGVRSDQADGFAVRLALMPYEIWDEWWDLPVFVPEEQAS